MSTFVQDPSSANLYGMPRSAMAAGVADFVLSPADIAKRLAELVRHPYLARDAEVSDTNEIRNSIWIRFSTFCVRSLVPISPTIMGWRQTDIHLSCRTR